jgi:hypothetical protein
MMYVTCLVVEMKTVVEIDDFLIDNVVKLSIFAVFKVRASGRCLTSDSSSHFSQGVSLRSTYYYARTDSEGTCIVHHHHKKGW